MSVFDGSKSSIAFKSESDAISQAYRCSGREQSISERSAAGQVAGFFRRA
jgi:hypothetical protein